MLWHSQFQVVADQGCGYGGDRGAVHGGRRHSQAALAGGGRGSMDRRRGNHPRLGKGGWHRDGQDGICHSRLRAGGGAQQKVERGSGKGMTGGVRRACLSAA